VIYLTQISVFWPTVKPNGLPYGTMCLSVGGQGCIVAKL